MKWLRVLIFSFASILRDFSLLYLEINAVNAISYQNEILNKEVLVISKTPSIYPTSNHPSLKPTRTPTKLPTKISSRSPTISSLFSDPSKIIYISFISSSSPLTKAITNIYEYKQLMKSDDSPSIEVTLPWSFTFLGDNIYNIYISPNGAIHRRLSQPCDYGTWIALPCKLANDNSPFYNLIGGLYTDLYPAGSADGNITSYYNEESFTVSFTDIVYYGTKHENSFRITLFKDSHIEISYDKIYVDSIYPNNNDWISGLRSSPSIINTDFTNEQIDIGKKYWYTSVKGIYPHPENVRSGKQFNICPISKHWCIQQNVINYNQIDNVVSHLNVTSLLLSCKNELDYGIILTSSDLLSQWSVGCNVSDVSSISCSIATILSTLEANRYNLSGLISIQPAWKTKFDQLYTAININKMHIELINHSSNATSVLTCDSTLTYTNSSCLNNCTLCNRDYSCLDNKCNSLNVFDHPNCNNECPSLKDIYNNVNHYDIDNYGTCCMSNETSCTGRCKGNEVLSINTDGSIACCPSAKMLDCNGVCEGSAIRDCLGICNGNTIYDCENICGGISIRDCKGICNGKTIRDCNGICGGTAKRDCAGICNGKGILDFCGICNGNDYDATSGCLQGYKGFNISTNTIENALYPVFTIEDGHSGMFRILSIYINNETPYIIKVNSLQDSNKDQFVPEVDINPVVSILNPKQSITININISLISLYQDDTGVLIWGIRSIYFQYNRIIYPNELYNYPISFNIYPSTIQCNSITTKYKCTSFPGCIFCMEYPNMRILSNQTLLKHNYKYNNISYYQLNRKLFSNIIPQTIINSNIKNNEQIGYCSDGWVTEQCFNSLSYSIYSKENTIYYTIISIIFTISFYFIY